MVSNTDSHQQLLCHTNCVTLTMSLINLNLNPEICKLEDKVEELTTYAVWPRVSESVNWWLQIHLLLLSTEYTCRYVFSQSKGNCEFTSYQNILHKPVTEEK